MLKELKVERGHLVLDPFLGVGTTCLACREAGIASIGVDVSPLFVMVSRVKTRDYDVDILRKTREKIIAQRFIRPDIRGINGFVRQLFSKYALEDLVFLREKINEIEDDTLREFFILALMNAAEKTSYIYRDGAVIKIRKDIPRPPSLRKMFGRVVKMMIKDVERPRLEPVAAEIFRGDARMLEFLEDEMFDVVITSPPYLNKIEYTKAYWPEYELFFPNVKIDPLRAYISLTPKEPVSEPLLDIEMPPIARAYFSDMLKVFGELFRVLKYGGKVAMVVGGGVFPDRVIDVDIPLARLAADVGFTVKRIIAVNKRAATTRRVIKIGESRESILIMQKE
ncbi:MAG: DNA methyltransferase [Aigarchaeota archaeon]|nr:DNA methyltransferase [Candidatus Pelearchaeum maunauluense]